VVEAGTAAFDAVSARRIGVCRARHGRARAAPAAAKNWRKRAGDVELRVASLEVLSSADALPFAISGAVEPPEDCGYAIATSTCGARG